jgi:RNA polymerase sigma-70 factor (family 1)
MRKYNPVEEKKVLELLAQGNEFAFTLLFDHYRGRIFTVAVRFLKSRELAEEVVQEVFLKIWTRREDLLTVLNFEAYLITIARNLVFDLVKDIARETITRNDFVSNVQQPIGADEGLIEEQYRELLNEAVSQLPPQQKQIFRLAKVEGLSHQAIAEQLHLSRLTVKTHMAKALQSIRENLQHHIISICLLFLIPGLL